MLEGSAFIKQESAEDDSIGIPTFKEFIFFPALASSPKSISWIIEKLFTSSG